MFFLCFSTYIVTNFYRNNSIGINNNKLWDLDILRINTKMFRCLPILTKPLYGMTSKFVQRSIISLRLYCRDPTLISIEAINWVSSS